MDVPTGLKVSPTTAHIMSHLPDRKSAKEMAMATSDMIIEQIKVLEILRKALHKYAAEDDSCSATRLLKIAGQAMEPMATTTGAMIAELCVLHQLHHMHGDPEVQAKFLDEFIESLAGTIKEARAAGIAADQELRSQISPNTFVDVLMGLLGRR